jgi:HK97 gp10 family phage protein
MAVKGIGGLKRKLAALPALVEKRGREAMEKSADEIVAMMKRLVPVDDGDLRDSIAWTWGEAPKGAVVIAQSEPRPGNVRLTIYAGNAKAYYARWTEFGTVKMSAQPFFFPSYRSLRARTRRRIMTATRKALKEVAAMPDGG